MDTVLLVIAILCAAILFMVVVFLGYRIGWRKLKIPILALVVPAVLFGLVVVGMGVHCELTYESTHWGGWENCWDWPWDISR